MKCRFSFAIPSIKELRLLSFGSDTCRAMSLGVILSIYCAKNRAKVMLWILPGYMLLVIFFKDCFECHCNPEGIISMSLYSFAGAHTKEE